MSCLDEQRGLLQTAGESRTRRTGSTLIRPAASAALSVLAIAASLFAAPSLSGLFGAGLGLLMLAIAAADARSYRIPNSLTAAAFALGLAAAALAGPAAVVQNLADAGLRGLASALVFFALREIYFRLRRRHGIGLGDVKLAAVAGTWLDWPLIPVAVEIAALGALAAYVAASLARRRPMSRTARMPFGVYFAPAIWLCWMLGAALLDG
jgi:leader peptidase (prepilin peptidase)/N-methyltransferase